MSKVKTYTVMHDKGEYINGKLLQAHETFKSVSTPEIEIKVKKGMLIDGGLTPAEKNVAEGLLSSVKKTVQRKSARRK